MHFCDLASHGESKSRASTIKFNEGLKDMRKHSFWYDFVAYILNFDAGLRITNRYDRLIFSVYIGIFKQDSKKDFYELRISHKLLLSFNIDLK